MARKLPTRLQLGDEVKCRHTGFSGIAYGVTIWMNDCVRVTVRSHHLSDKGEPLEVTFDEDDLEVKDFVSFREDENHRGAAN